MLASRGKVRYPMIVIIGSAMCAMSAASIASGAAGDGRMDALLLCQEAIKSVAQNPSSAEVPYAKDYGSASEHYFAWPKGSGLTMMNGFGANVDVSASCTTTGDGKRITSLSVNGKTVL